jgi:glycolate oxidase FAD binding subunit
VQQSSCLIEDLGPLPVFQPAAVPELRDLVRRVVAELADRSATNQAIYPLGGQTMLDFGLPPVRPGIGIDLRGLAQVIDYPARDMTITVQAGITLAKLREILAAENQRLPIDVPQPDRATLGGTIAANVSGPRRYGFGTLRDYVIGISVVNDEGQEIKAGGRVVKNVAGYDLCKLYIGSLGTLSIITQVTLKLKPRPEEQSLVVAGCEPGALGPLLDEVHRSRTRPVCLDLLNRAAVSYINQQPGNITPKKGTVPLMGEGPSPFSDLLPERPWLLVIGFEDNQEAVKWQTQQLQDELSRAGFQVVETRIGSAAEPLWQALAEFPGAWNGMNSVLPRSRLTFKANLLPHRVAEFCRRAAEVPHQLLLQAHAGNGIVIGHAEGDLTLEQTRTMLNELRDTAAAGQGSLIIRRCPTAWKRELPVWGTPRGDAVLMRAIKEKLDPRRLFNPGRFVDGL